MPAPEQLQAQVTLGSHLAGGEFGRVQLVEGVAEQLFRQLPSKHLRIQRQLGGALGKLVGTGLSSADRKSRQSGQGFSVLSGAC